jgi:uncharacterized membrane protein YfcA
MASRRAALALALGFAAGVGSGLLGVGGGMVMVPGLVLALGATQHQAHATSLVAIVPIGLVGFIVFAIHGNVHYGYAGLFVAGALAGAPAGARLMTRLPERALAVIFAGVMVFSAIRLLT